MCKAFEKILPCLYRHPVIYGRLSGLRSVPHVNTKTWKSERFKRDLEGELDLDSILRYPMAWIYPRSGRTHRHAVTGSPVGPESERRMARLNAVGDEELLGNGEIRSGWRRLLAEEDEFIYDGQAEINRQIVQRLPNEQASRSKGEVLATFLEEQMHSFARSELFILCIMSVVTRLNLEIQVLRNMKEDDVRSCVARAQSWRLMLAGYAETFLKKHWPGWGDIGENGNPSRQYSQIIVEELAKLYKLGISKEDPKVRLKAQTNKRRTAKLPGVSNTPALQRIDIKAVIADITGIPLTQGAALKSEEKKAKGKKDIIYHPPSNHLKTDGPP